MSGHEAAGHSGPDPGDGAREALARRALTLALRTATALLRSPDEARDVAQDVAVIALARHGQLRDPERFDAWVHRIAVRESYRVLRASERRRHRERPLDDETAGALTASATDHDAHLTARQALEGLPPRERIALTLRYVHGLSDRQIADAMRCRPGTVGSLLSRGRDRLRSGPELRALAPTPIPSPKPSGGLL